VCVCIYIYIYIYEEAKVFVKSLAPNSMGEGIKKTLGQRDVV
jgi:hypothetical protein